MPEVENAVFLSLQNKSYPPLVKEVEWLIEGRAYEEHQVCYLFKPKELLLF